MGLCVLSSDSNSTFFCVLCPTDSIVELRWWPWPLPSFSCCAGCSGQPSQRSQRNQDLSTSSPLKVLTLSPFRHLPPPPRASLSGRRVWGVESWLNTQEIESDVWGRGLQEEGVGQIAGCGGRWDKHSHEGCWLVPRSGGVGLALRNEAGVKDGAFFDFPTCMFRPSRDGSFFYTQTWSLRISLAVSRLDQTLNDCSSIISNRGSHAQSRAFLTNQYRKVERIKNNTDAAAYNPVACLNYTCTQREESGGGAERKKWKNPGGSWDEVIWIT